MEELARKLVPWVACVMGLASLVAVMRPGLPMMVVSVIGTGIALAVFNAWEADRNVTHVQRRIVERDAVSKVVGQWARRNEALCPVVARPGPDTDDSDWVHEICDGQPAAAQAMGHRDDLEVAVVCYPLSVDVELDGPPRTACLVRLPHPHPDRRLERRHLRRLRHRLAGRRQQGGPVVEALVALPDDVRRVHVRNGYELVVIYDGWPTAGDVSRDEPDGAIELDRRIDDTVALANAIITECGRPRQ